MKKLSIAGKQIPAVFIALLLCAGVGSAALIDYFGQVTSIVTVEQAIVVTGELSTTIPDAVGSQTYYSNEASIDSNTVNDLDVNFTNDCVPDCVGITITNQVELNVVGAAGAGDPWDKLYYKATDYEASSSLDELTVTYSFEIISNILGDDLAPYIVLVGEKDGGQFVAVQMIPDGGTYTIGTKYSMSLDDATFHVPGSTICTQQTPCDIAGVKSDNPGATVNRVRLAVGAFTRPSDLSMSVLMGIGTINGVQAEHMKLKIYGNSVIPTIQKYDFAPNIWPGQYTITTEIVPVA